MPMGHAIRASARRSAQFRSDMQKLFQLIDQTPSGGSIESRLDAALQMRAALSMPSSRSSTPSTGKRLAASRLI